ncbi:MAG TPA: hypothetical protein VIT92_12475 [Burkholderiaceae bacterium]
MLGREIHLRSFSEQELIFDEQETREILTFFFRYARERIANISINDEARNFAQGLLVEAIDATYALGYIQIVLQTYYNPGQGIKKILMKIARKAAHHWFKHAQSTHLTKAKISERVRDRLALNFKSEIELLLSDAVSYKNTMRSGMIWFERSASADALWG